ncbi:hypothetical protein TWF730_007421 [Orbilia blumenaviensis]|uniref:Ankyrin repeat protein n=1 Tax=Orbilia blumenaviensis TaxID=1796055 RepID=A0AAV9V7P7_9PEZI
MSASTGVVAGRINKKKRYRAIEESNQLIRRISEPKPQNTRAKPTDILARYDVELKYYYLSRRYTLEKAREIMEILFRTGATASQYIGHVDRQDFEKKLTPEKWIEVAPYFYYYKNQKCSLGVKLNGSYIIDPVTVEREIRRNTKLTEQNRMKRLACTRSDTDYSLQAFTSDRIELYVPSSKVVRQKIPENILKQLPMFSIESLLHQASERLSSSGEIGGAANIFNIKTLKILFYKLSNNLARPIEVDRLLDQIMKSGHRSSLKMLFSFNVLPVKVTAEHMIPILLLRQDKDIIESIFEFCGLVPVQWYKHLFRVLSALVSSPDKSDEGHYDIKRLASKYNSASLRQFIIQGLNSVQFCTETVEEALALALSAFKYQLIPLDLIPLFLPQGLNWGEIEEFYFNKYGKAILEIKGRVGFSELLGLGFRRNLAYITLEAVLNNDIYKASVCFRELGFPPQFSEKLRNGAQDGEPLMAWEIIGVEYFHRLVLAAHDDKAFPFGYMLYAAYLQNNEKFGDFLLKFLRSFSGCNEKRVLLDALIIILASMESSHHQESSRWFDLVSYSDCSAIAEWLDWFTRNGININMSFIRLGSGYCNLFCYTVYKRLINASLFLLERVKEICTRETKNHHCLSASYYILLLYGISRDGSCGDLTAGEALLLGRLLDRGVFIDHFTKGELRQEFKDALTKRDISLTTRLWRYRWVIGPEDWVEGNGLRKNLLQWHLTPPNEQERQAHTEKIITGLKSEGLEWYPTRRIWIRDLSHSDSTSYEIQIYNVLQTLAAIANPVLLREAFVHRHDEAVAELNRSHEYAADLSPLQIAVIQGNLDCVKILLEMGADPREGVRWQYLGKRYTALHYAIKHGHLHITQVLLEYGARVCSPHENPVGEGIPEGPVELAVRLGRLDFLGLLLQVDHSARHEALLAAKKYSQINITAWIEQYWMGIPQRKAGDKWIYMTHEIERLPHAGSSRGAIEYFLDQDILNKDGEHRPQASQGQSIRPTSDEESNFDGELELAADVIIPQLEVEDAQMNEDMPVSSTIEGDTRMGEDHTISTPEERDTQMNENSPTSVQIDEGCPTPAQIDEDSPPSSLMDLCPATPAQEEMDTQIDEEFHSQATEGIFEINSHLGIEMQLPTLDEDYDMMEDHDLYELEETSLGLAGQSQLEALNTEKPDAAAWRESIGALFPNISFD